MRVMNKIELNKKNISIFTSLVLFGFILRVCVHKYVSKIFHSETFRIAMIIPFFT